MQAGQFAGGGIPKSPLSQAIETLRRMGHDVRYSRDLPGCFIVDSGPDLTVRELLRLASRAVTKEARHMGMS